MKYMFMALATSLVVLFLLLCYCRYFDNFYSNAYCFSLLWLYLGNSQVSVYRTIGPTLVSVISESTRNAEIRDAYAGNERENRQIVSKPVAIYNQKH